MDALVVDPVSSLPECLRHRFPNQIESQQFGPTPDTLQGALEKARDGAMRLWAMIERDREKQKQAALQPQPSPQPSQPTWAFKPLDTDAGTGAEKRGGGGNRWGGRGNFRRDDRDRDPDR
eukprot:1629446-Rhodomonas_salina.1